jgi:hypothetical protein
MLSNHPARDLQQSCDPLVGDAVVDVLSVPSTCDVAAPAQAREVRRGARLGLPNTPHQFGDVLFSLIEEQLDDPHPCRVGEAPKELGRQLQALCFQFVILFLCRLLYAHRWFPHYSYAQQESFDTSRSKAMAPSFNPSAIVRYGAKLSTRSATVSLCLTASVAA